MNQNNAKNLDHLVLPVPSLDVARRRLTALGFTVAPDGHHPFGTENACVFFQDDTYLEPLAIGNKDVYEVEANKGNVFLRRDQLYRQRNGDNGFSLIALTTEDAASDKQAHEQSGYDCGPMVAFRRDVAQPDGSNRQISVNLFITSTDTAPDLALFSCQWLSGKVFDDEHKRHANGALGITAIALADNDWAAREDYLSTVGGQGNIAPHIDGPEFGKSLTLANGALHLLTAAGFKHHYGLDVTGYGPGLRALTFEVAVENLEKVEQILNANAIHSQAIGPRLVVPAADGQGYTLAFSQSNGT